MAQDKETLENKKVISSKFAAVVVGVSAMTNLSACASSQDHRMGTTEFLNAIVTEYHRQDAEEKRAKGWHTGNSELDQ